MGKPMPLLPAISPSDSLLPTLPAPTLFPKIFPTVCPLGAFGADGQSRVLARGNKGPGQTGSNGNAGPLNAAGFVVDPAAELKKKQDIAYTLWAEQQIRNAEKQLGTAGR